MKKYKHLACLFSVLALLLSNVMCAAVAYNYCSLLWCGRYGGCSAPANTAFLLCIPYGAGILICTASARFFNQKHKKFL